MAYRRVAYRVMVVRPSVKRHKRRREDNIKMDIQEVKWVGTDWIAVAQDRGRWRALVNEVMNPRVPYNAGNFFLTADLLASQEGLCSMEFVSVVGTIAHVQFTTVCDSWRRLLTDTCGMLTVADVAAQIALIFVPCFVKHSSSNCSEDNVSGT
jgi:hypothetical protein